MSNTFYFELNPQKVNISQNYLQSLIQYELGSDYKLKISLFEKQFGGHFYIDKKSSRGVEVFLHERKFFVMKLNILANEADYLICEKMLSVLVKKFDLEIHLDEEDLILDSEQLIKDYFQPEKIQHNRKIESDVIIKLILRARNNIRFDGVNNPVYFGMDFVELLEKKNATDEQTIVLFDQIMHKLQWELPDYIKPSPAVISRKDKSKEYKIRMMFKDYDYILNDYEFLLIGDTGNDEIVFINNDDLKQIINELNLPWQRPDGFTVISTKLNQTDWNKFVEASKKLNRQKEIDEPIRFMFEVTDVFRLNKVDILLGKGNIPLFEGKIRCGNIQLDVTPVYGNTEDTLNNLSFQVKKGTADKSMIGKIFMEVQNADS